MIRNKQIVQQLHVQTWQAAACSLCLRRDKALLHLLLEVSCAGPRACTLRSRMRPPSLLRVAATEPSHANT